MGVRQAILVIAFVATLLPSVSNAQAVSADAMIAACQSRARLTDQWNPLQAERDQLTQRLKDFGFENASAQQDAMGERADEILRNNGVNARKDFMAKSANEAASAMNGFLQNLETNNRALNPAELGQLQQMALRLPEKARESIMAIAQAPRIPIPGSPLWRRAIDAVGYASTAHTLATTESTARLGWEGFMAAAGVVNPPLGLIVSNLDYAANNLWGLGQLAWTAQQIRALTNATEADLKLMKTTTDRMNVVGKELGKVRAGLNALPPCDSTQLVRGDLGPPPQPPVPEAPENTAANSSGGGNAAGKIIGISAAGAGAVVGGVMLADYAQSIKCTQFETQMQTRLNAVLTAVNNYAVCTTTSCFNSRIGAVNSAASAILDTAGQWCTCLGPSGVTELSAADKASVRDAFNTLRSLSVNPGSMPACFR